MTDIAKTAATQTQVSDIAAQIIEETVRRCQALHEYAGRPAWEQVIRDVIQKHLVAMLAMERERCKEILRYNHTIVAGAPLDPAVPEIIHVMEHGGE